ncbi:hypothetical protein K2173_023009 [Erythroxylum novogranatense]|uniref:Hpc2-related domain-containing protein n=1 Tax=Erythroxylum novogranatense TaxID=1862640 RepID=A0AAV8T806_9ROSI|nr:hypothetical protein K2173_023009 [Erythroxylum novogranatense]
MDESSAGDGSGTGGEPSSSTRLMPSYVKVGDRQIFTVELRPGETTFVSWKKLIKDANKVSSGSVHAPDPPPVNAQPNLESRIAPGQLAEKEAKDAPPPNRFSAVIEKIERLYGAKDSSDEEDLKDIPDDDQYDTEDSFIDDAELDEYFEVDNSAIKHDGFFVNRGKLERIEPNVVPTHQPKKRRRKDMVKAPDENDDGQMLSNKQAKLGKIAAGKPASTPGKSATILSQNVVVTSEHHEDMKYQGPSSAPGISSKKKSVDAKMSPSSIMKASNGDGSISLAEVKEIEKSKAGGLQVKNHTDKSKDASEFPDSSYHSCLEKIDHEQLMSSSARPVNFDELEPSIRSKEKNGIRELPDLNLPDSRISMQTTKNSHIHKRDGSFVRPKSSMLEKSIRELEKMVAESRIHGMENQEADSSSQAIKRRLPREVKLKLAKVARLAQASQGKISKELINRLMNSLGHLIQLRTLKRNLKVMISMGLSAKQEKDDRFRQIKKEVAEIVKTRVPTLESKAFEQQARASVGSQGNGAEEKGALKKKFSMDAVLEDKICDLYDLFVDGLDEDAGPQVRKLYVELAELWPSGFMDNHGIKRAICRAKERRRAIYSRHKDQDKINRKKMTVPKTEDAVRGDAGSVVQPQYAKERLTTDTGGPILALASKPSTNSNTSAVWLPSSSANAPNTEKPRLEKPKASLNNNSMDEGKMAGNGALTKKKFKRKPEQELDESLLERVQPQSSEERQKAPTKQPSGVTQKLNLQLAATTPAPEPVPAPSSFQQS